MFCHNCKYLILHETSHIETFQGTDFENGNSSFLIQARKIAKYEIFFENLKFFLFLNEALSEPNIF